MTFDSRGRIVTVCVGVDGPAAAADGPADARHAREHDAAAAHPGTGSIFNDFAGGGYFYLDNRDRAVIPTTTRHLYVVAVGEGGFALERDYDLTAAVPLGDKIISALPDWSGRYWFASTRGVMGTVDPASGALKARDLGEDISNSFAVDNEGGVYVVTQKAMYRLDPAADGTPAVTWREQYENSGIAKPGQVHAGSGTTPTVMEQGLGGDRRQRRPDERGRVPPRPGGERRPGGMPAAGVRPGCLGHRPVADRGEPFDRGGEQLRPRQPDLRERRQDHEPRHRARRPRRRRAAAAARSGTATRSRRRWCPSSRWRPGSSTPTPSRGAATTRTPGTSPRSTSAAAGPSTRRLAGTGLGYNNNFAPVTLGPDGSAYVGALGGLILVRDARQPSGPPASSPRGCRAQRPRLSLSLRYRRGRTSAGRAPAFAGAVCARGAVRASLAGADRRRARRVGFYLGRRRVKLDRPVSLLGADRRPPPRRQPPSLGQRPRAHERWPAGHAQAPLPRLRGKLMDQIALRNRLLLATAMWKDDTQEPLPKLPPGEPAEQLSSFELLLVDMLCAQGHPGDGAPGGRPDLGPGARPLRRRSGEAARGGMPRGPCPPLGAARRRRRVSPLSRALRPPRKGPLARVPVHGGRGHRLAHAGPAARRDGPGRCSS